jgi:Orsellinic acid/F9775 biosynthesis cluster protein D
MDLDLLYFDSHYRVAVYRHCQCAVVPREIAAHLRTLHKATYDLTNAKIRRCAKSFLT